MLSYIIKLKFSFASEYMYTHNYTYKHCDFQKAMQWATI